MELKYSDGLIPAVIQDRHSGKVLMLGYMNDEAYRKTLESGFVTFFSRSRQKLWTKGETSGHRLKVREIRVVPKSSRVSTPRSNPVMIRFE